MQKHSKSRGRKDLNHRNPADLVHTKGRGPEHWRQLQQQWNQNHRAPHPQQAGNKSPRQLMQNNIKPMKTPAFQLVQHKKREAIKTSLFYYT